MSEVDAAKIAVVELLQKNGILDSLKAQLRSSVFLALQTTPHAAKNRTEKSAQDSELAFLVRDFLLTLGLQHTAAVFDAEWGQAIEGTDATRSITKTDPTSTLIGSVFKAYKSGSIISNSPAAKQLDTLVSTSALKPLAPLAKEMLGAVKKLPPPPPPPSKIIDDATTSQNKSRSVGDDKTQIQGKEEASINKPPELSAFPLEQITSSSLQSPSATSSSRKTPNSLAIEIDADMVKTLIKDRIDTPLAVKLPDDELVSRDKAPRQRYRSNNQASEDFYQAPASQTAKKEDLANEEDSAGSEQFSSDRSATKAPESSVDYFEPVLKDF